MNTEKPLWQPDQATVEGSNLHFFMRYAESHTGRTFSDFAALHAWSVGDSVTFWSLLWDFCEVIGDRGERELLNGDDIENATWFPDARLNFAENLLRERSDRAAILFQAEDRVTRELSYSELYDQVAAVAAWLEQQGIDTSAWTELWAYRVRRDDQGTAFCGVGERTDGMWQLFVALVPDEE